MTGIIIILIILVLLAIWVAGIYNGLIRSRNTVDEGFSTMDVYLKKRHDLIPNLVETVKGYAKHESETLIKVTEARKNAMAAASDAEKMQSENELSRTLRSLFAVAEQYPELKANQNFLELQRQLQSVEDDIASSRKYYNAVVKEYNNKREVFPNNFVSNMFSFEKRSMFELEDIGDRDEIKVDFGS